MSSPEGQKATDGSDRDWDLGVICYNCSKKIGGMSTMFGSGRHHCRRCGHSFCQACSSSTASIEQSKPVRVCDTCYQTLIGGEHLPVLSPAQSLQGWVKVKQGHAGVLDHSRWRARFFEIEPKRLRLWHKRSHALLRQEDPPELDLILGPHLTLTIENKSSAMEDWILHVETVGAPLECCVENCLRFKADPDRLETPDVVEMVWTRLVQNLTALHGEVPWDPEQQYGIKPHHKQGACTQEHDELGRTVLASPNRERTLDQIVQGHVVQSMLVGEITHGGIAGAAPATQSFDVVLTEDQLLIYPCCSASQTRESRTVSAAQFSLYLVNMNSGCPAVDQERCTFSLATDIFQCVFRCADQTILTRWVTAISDNMRRLRHVERSAAIIQPKVISAGSRLRHVMISLGGTSQQIQRAFRCSYETWRETIPGFLGIGASQLWFVSNGSSHKLAVSLSQIYNVTLESVADDPLRQLLSFAIQRHTTDEWRLSFECPLEAQQAQVLVGQLWRETHGTGEMLWANDAPQSSSQLCTRSELVQDLQHSFHIPHSEIPVAMVGACMLTQQETPDSWQLPPESEQCTEQLVSGTLAVFNWALVFVAESGSMAAGIGAFAALQHSQRNRRQRHRHLRLVVMADQMELIEWDKSACRLKLFISESDCAEARGSSHLEFHLIQGGPGLAQILTQIRTQGPELLRLSSTTLLQSVSPAERWQGYKSLRSALAVFREQHPEQFVLDPDALQDMPLKVEVYGYDTNGFQLVTPTDWRRALDSCAFAESMKQARMGSLMQHLERTQYRSVLVVTEQLAELAKKGFPPEIRGQLWMASIFAITKAQLGGSGYYEALLAEVSEAERIFESRSGELPVRLASDLEQIRRDMDENRTETAHCLMYRRNGLTPSDFAAGRASAPEHGFSDAVRRVCCAFSMRNHNSIGYAQGMGSVVVHLLLVLPEEQAFWVLCCMFEDLLPDHFGYKGGDTGLAGVHDVGKEACKTLLEHLVDEIVPHFWRYLEEDGEVVRTYVRGNIFEKWMNCLFCGESCGFPSETVQRILDLLFVQGFHMIFAVAIAIIKLLPLDPLVYPAERFCLLSENQKVIARSLHDADALIKMTDEIALLPQLQPSAIWHAHAALVVRYQQFKLLCAASFEPGSECSICSGSSSQSSLCPSTDPERTSLTEQEVESVVHAVTDVNWCGAETNDRTALHFAAKALNVPVVNQLVRHPEIKLDEQDDQGSTALLLATTKTCLCRSGCKECSGKQRQRLQVVDTLVTAGSSLSIQDRAGNTVLHNSSTGHGGFPQAQRLVKAWWPTKDIHPDLLNTQNKVGYTALHLAAHHGIQVTVDLLLKYGADVNSRGLLCETPLHTAAQNNQYEIVETLCANGAIVDAPAGDVGWNSLHIACCEDHRDVAYKLVLHRTLTFDNQKLVDLPTHNGFTPLQIAVIQEHHEMVDFLKAADASFPKELLQVSDGTNPNQEPETNLTMSYSQNNLDFLRSCVHVQSQQPFNGTQN